MNFKISIAAEKDLEKIWLYTFEMWSLKQADFYYNLILDEIEHLAENPQIGKDVSFIKKGYYRSRIKSHFIFYKINLKDKEVEIIRILHQQMDINARIAE